MTSGRKKRQRPIPVDKTKRIIDVVKRAKAKSVDLLVNSLSEYGLSNESDISLIRDVASEFGVDCPITNEGTLVVLDKQSAKMISRGVGKRHNTDDHNETCEVCDKGGDLLCCDTCSLVFHLKCIRPKISEVPKGSWSCAHCIDDGTATGDVEVARRAIRTMNRIRRTGVTDPSSNEECVVDPNELSLVRAGRRFILRRESLQLEDGRRTVTDLG
eukprot:gene12036-25224_t